MKYLKIWPILPLMLCGCGGDYPPPPKEHNDLVLRFFRSIRSNENSAAVRQGEKLLKADEKNHNIRQLLAIQQANSFLLQAQGKLNSGDLPGASEAVRSGLRRYPDNPELQKAKVILQKLSFAPKFFEAMRNAPNPAAMTSALIAARAGLGGLNVPELERFFSDYERLIREKSAASAVRKSGEPVLIRSFDDK